MLKLSVHMPYETLDLQLTAFNQGWKNVRKVRYLALPSLVFNFKPNDS